MTLTEKINLALASVLFCISGISRKDVCKELPEVFGNLTSESAYCKLHIFERARGDAESLLRSLYSDMKKFIDAKEEEYRMGKNPTYQKKPICKVCICHIYIIIF